MEPFTTHSGIAIPLDRSNVDTDALLPKQYLKMLGKTGFGGFLFDDERYLDPGDVETPLSERRVNPDFLLNREPYREGTVLLSRRNFGCGSSREHAVWALRDFGIRVVVAESFGDIFFNNCFNNGLLPVILDERVLDELMASAQCDGGLTITVDVEQCQLRAGGACWSFVMDPGRRDAMLSGLNEIGRTLTYGDAIRNYEAKRRGQEPWVFD